MVKTNKKTQDIMNQYDFEKFWISQVAVIIRNNKCLILKFAGESSEYWGLPGGRIDKGEANQAPKSFSREISEELGIKKFKLVDLIDYHTWYVQGGAVKGLAICGVAFLVIIDKNQQITLSHEHTNYEWIAQRQISKYKFAWPDVPVMIRKGFKKYKQLYL